MTFLVGVLIFPAIIGLFVIWHIARPQHSPADESNRLNKARLLWFALTREELFADCLPWLKQDELANVDELDEHERAAV